ncbi:MAG: protein-L-isoaspartate O-methyltransferase [Promethearchaeota archaeon]
MDINDRFKENLKLKKKRLLDSLIVNEILKDKRLIKAFMDVPLEKFIPDKFINIVKLYEDVPNLFYYDEQNPDNYRTISAPHMITIMLQGLSLTEDDDLLILGAKSGYIAALAHKLAPKGEIIILEANSEIAKFTSENLKRLKLDENISIIVKNPLNGMSELSPWQKILVTGAIEQSKITPLLHQLDENGGVLFAPIGHEFIQIYTQILRKDNEYFGRKKLQVKFSPLITKVEIDELELITDFDEYGISDDSTKAIESVNHISKKINIKYTSDILDDINSESSFKIESIDKEQQKLVINNLMNIELLIRKLKKEDDIDNCFNYVESIETKLEDLKKYKKLFQIKIKRMQNILNQIRSYNIVRNELEKKDLQNAEIIDKKIEIINKQIEQINLFLEIIKEDIQRVKMLY